MTTPTCAPWNLTGHEEIDRQHAVLFSLVDRVRSSTRVAGRDVIVPDLPAPQLRALRSVVEELTTYTVDHFAYEERMMAATSYPDSERHRASHRAITNSIIQLVEALDAGQSPAHLINAVLDGWLRHHIGNIDRELADFILANQPQAVR